MTPLQLEILLHYYSRADDYRCGDFGAPAVRDAIEYFKREELIVAADPKQDRCYALGERGRVLVEAVRSVPLPERRWVMPSIQPAYVTVNMQNPPGPTPHPIHGWQPMAAGEHQ